MVTVSLTIIGTSRLTGTTSNFGTVSGSATLIANQSVADANGRRVDLDKSFTGQWTSSTLQGSLVTTNRFGFAGMFFGPRGREIAIAFGAHTKLDNNFRGPEFLGFGVIGGAQQ